jgi:hypothetical protein
MEGYLKKYYNSIFKKDNLRYYIIDFENGKLNMYKQKWDNSYSNPNELRVLLADDIGYQTSLTDIFQLNYFTENITKGINPLNSGIYSSFTATNTNSLIRTGTSITVGKESFVNLYRKSGECKANAFNYTPKISQKSKLIAANMEPAMIRLTRNKKKTGSTEKNSNEIRIL